jgi:hypothetical protein
MVSWATAGFTRILTLQDPGGTMFWLAIPYLLLFFFIQGVCPFCPRFITLHGI